MLDRLEAEVTKVTLYLAKDTAKQIKLMAAEKDCTQSKLVNDIVQGYLVGKEKPS